jgi:epoxyqueuosine reductase
MKDAIRQRARELGFQECQFTSAAPPATAVRFQEWIAQGWHGDMQYLARNAFKRVAPDEVLAGAKSILVLGATYFSQQTQVIPGSAPGTPMTGQVARYARYRDYHDILAPGLKSLCEFITGLGLPGTRSLWYVDTGPFLERDLAQRAGMGFAGKHTNLVSRRFGNWLFLAEIITTLELEPDPPQKNLCGTCTRCISACPTEAITAPFQLDARRCISYLTIELKGAIPEPLRPAIGRQVYGCDLCLEACPWNRFAREGALMKAHGKPELGTLDLLELLALDEAAFKLRFQGTPILRTKRRGLLRNVCVALGNIGDARALPALGKARQDPEPLIAEHADWAIRRIESASTAPSSVRSQ